MPKRYRLKIKRLDFISAVDAGAQGPISDVALIKRAGDEVAAMFQVAKADESLGLVFGWAMASSLDGGKTPHVDLQGDAIESGDDLIKVCAEFMSGAAAADVMHDGEQDGRVVFMMPLVDEVKRALGVTSDVEGVAVAIKPSPETFARFKSGELSAFSIGGEGTRTELEDATSKRLAAERVELEKQVAKLAAEKEYEKRAVAEHSAWLDKMAKEHGLEVAKQIAEWNRSSIGKWGEVWLEKNAAAFEVEKAAPDDTIEEIAKRAESAVAKAQADVDAYVAKKAKEWKTSHDAAFCRLMGVTPGRTDAERAEFGKIYQASADARHDLQTGEAGIAKQLETLNREHERVSAELAKMTEAFCLAHDIEAGAAYLRLTKISPTFRDLVNKQRELERERAAVPEIRRQQLEQYRADKARKQQLAEREREVATRKAAQPLPQRKLELAVEAYQKAHNIEHYAVAFNKALQNDPDVRRLYEESREGAR